MTYSGFLLRFLVIPILLLLGYHLWKRHTTLAARPVWTAISVHIVLALLYTTPWDNYLVATGVWYYNPALVTGILLGTVPLEEYVFFILQTLFVGLWWWFLLPRLTPAVDFQPSGRIRLWASAVLAALWLISATVFLSGWKPGTYLSITLFWALPPLILQSIFGADILWHTRRLMAATILPIGLYLSFADSLAITATTWEIDPAQSTGIFLGRLPVEEGIFFFITVILVTSGISLLRAPQSYARWRSLKAYASSIFSEHAR